MKKLLLILAFAMCFAVGATFTACGSASDGSDSSSSDSSSLVQPSEGLSYTPINGGREYYEVSDIGDCTDTNVIIPSTYNGLPVTSIGNFAFEDCSGLTEITIPDSVINIGTGAFSGCRSLTRVAIGNSVTSIGFDMFRGCSSLTDIAVEDNNTAYKSIDGNLYSKDGTTLIQYAIGKTATTFTIPDSVTSIGNYAFSDCDGLTSVTIPDSVTSIAWYAFSGCNSLTSVTFKNTVGWTLSYGSSSVDVTNAERNAVYFRTGEFGRLERKVN